MLYNYDFRNRSVSPEIGGNGTPALVTYDADQDLQDRLQHVVITYDPFRGRRIYVDGRWTDDVDEQLPGRLFNWDPNHVFALGNEIEQRPPVARARCASWRSTTSALTDAQIRQNFDAGVGKRLSMSFDVSRWAGPGSAIEFQVSEFDNASYMFCTADLPHADAGRLPARARAHRGQRRDRADRPGLRHDGHADHRARARQLSARCAVIPKGNGPTTDQFTHRVRAPRRLPERDRRAGCRRRSW